jgi:hypothetical protein
VLKVARVVSSRTIRAVPAGTGVLVWAASMPAKSRITGRAIHFFIGNLLKVQNNILVLTLVFRDGRYNTLRGQGNHRR